MASVRSRENTFKVDLSNFPKRPSFEEVHSFVHETIGLRHDQVKRLQMNHAQNCAHVKCCDLKTAQDAVHNHNERHELEVNKKKFKVRLQMDDGGVEVKIHDLSENISNQEVVAFLKQFGEILSIKELVWGDQFAYKGISSGVRVAKMVLHRHIRSFVTINGEQTLVTYRNQPQTCRHCTNLVHIGNTCVENKKLLGQKVDLNNRLKKAQNTHSAQGEGSNSYANVLSNKDSANSLLPIFVSTNLNELNERARSSPSTAASDEPSLPLLAMPPTAPIHAGEGTSTTEVKSVGERMDQSGKDDHSFAEMTEQRDTTNTAMDIDRTTKQSEKINDVHTGELATSFDTVSTFRLPSLPRPTKAPMDQSESDDSSVEGAPFQPVKRGRGRSTKKQKIDFPPLS